ncbi:uncharacterized protein METZ01_LOCUS510819, partial [marine metagenome]
MSSFDLIVKDGTVSTASDTFKADIAVNGRRIVALGEDLGTANQIVDAKNMMVLPGGIDSHCHIEQESSMKVTTADDFFSGSVSA